MSLEYSRPRRLNEACALLAEQPGRSRVLAGGTDLMVERRGGLRGADRLVDIKELPGLRDISWPRGKDLELGACVTMAEIARHGSIQRRLTALAEAAAAVGSEQIRSRATVGGNLSNCSPCADTAPALLVLGARLRITGLKGTREIPIRDYFQGVKCNTLEPGEILTHVLVPPPVKLRSGFLKMKRVRGPDLALVNLAGAYQEEQKLLRIAVGSAAPTPVLLPDLPHKGSPATLGKLAARTVLDSIHPIDDVRSSAEYRRDMAVLLTRQLVDRLLARPGRRR